MSEPGDKGAALVTGAGKRIGAVIARRLAREGYAVVLHCNRSHDDTNRLCAEILAAGGRAAIVRGDLALADDVEGLIDKAIAALGPVSLLVNNASIFEQDDASTFTSETLSKHFAINCQAPLLLARDLARCLPEGREGAIVNIIDQRVLRPDPKFFSYTISKAALLSATRTLAQALAPAIRVNAVGPGPSLANLHEGQAGLDAEIAKTLLQRRSSPDAIADAVIYLAGARSVTGQMIAVDSGQHLAFAGL